MTAATKDGVCPKTGAAEKLRDQVVANAVKASFAKGTNIPTNSSAAADNGENGENMDMARLLDAAAAASGGAKGGGGGGGGDDDDGAPAERFPLPVP